MFRRLLPWVLLVSLVLSACGDSRSFTWRHIDTRVQVRADGSLGVTETLTLAYSGGPFTFATRDLPERRLDGVRAISVSDGERAYTLVDDEDSKEPYTFSVTRDGDEQRVRWVYPATTGGERTFVLSYEVDGAVRRNGETDELWWTMVFGGRDEPVEGASGSITLPAPTPPEQLAASAPDAPATLGLDPGAVSFSSGPIPPERELSLRLSFPAGIVGGELPHWQAAELEQATYDATTRPTVNLALSLLTTGLAALFGALVWGWRRRNRDPQPIGFAGGALPAPPDDLPPALATRLTGGSDGQALLATLFDLANRGALVFREQQTAGAKLAVARTGDPTAPLAPYEASALAVVPAAGELALDGSAAQITAAQLVGKQAQAALLERALLDEAALARRRGGYLAGSLLIALGGGAMLPALLLAERVSWWLPAIAGVLLVAGVAWLIVAGAVRGLTQAGADALARWQAHQRHLQSLRPEAAPAGQFGLMLPFAVALGAAPELTRAYTSSAEPMPAWYYPLYIGGADGSGGGGEGLAGSLLLQDFSQNFVTAIGSASAGAGGSGGGADGGGGASGGGDGGAG
jgi:hypothetical protein